MYSSINIHHKTLNDCLASGTLYLNAFFFSLDLIEFTKTDLINQDQIKSLVVNKRYLYNVKHPAKVILEFKDDPRKNQIFDSFFFFLTKKKKIV